MSKRCCCGQNRSCCGCCCSRRAATITFSVVGLILAVSVIVPPVYVYMTDREFSKLFPALRLARKYLSDVTEAKFGPRNPETEVTDGGGIESPPGETYQLAIFQLLDDIQSKSSTLSFISFIVGCVNLPVHLLMFGGAVFRVPCLLTPWLALTLIEHVVLGVPFIVFVGIISLYLAAQLELCVIGGALIGGAVLLFLLSLSSWFTVYACYGEFCERQDDRILVATSEVTQPLLPNGNNAGGGYQLGQYYPPHHYQGRQLPSAPPGSGGGPMYPQLPTA